MNSGTNVIFFGEAMLELVNKEQNLLSKSFAGDVYNTSVYMSRAYPAVEAQYITAVGSDALSEEFVNTVKSENVGTDYIAVSSAAHLGAYMVVNDDQGERSFIYWRSASAAKTMMSALSSQQQQALVNSCNEDTYVFFSGISIAILKPEERVLFWSCLSELKSKGATIVFDPNYRPALWESEDVAKQQIEKAFTKSQWLMPGLDDFSSLYGLNSIEECIAFCEQFDYKELVLKQGAASVHVVNENGHSEFEIVKSTKVVDTTSAGDAFNGIYLGARLNGSEPKEATKLANYAASKVIETPGAIMQKSLFTQYWQDKP